MREMSDNPAIRPAAVAGQFYPRDPEELRTAIHQAFLSPLGPGSIPEVSALRRRRTFGIMVPHAGYPYSAQGAAWGFAELAADGAPEAIVLLGVNHHGIGAPLAMSGADGWETPLGIIPVAMEARRRLLALDADIRVDDRAHANEHSLEVQVPFIQAVLGVTSIIPLVISHAGMGEIARLGEALAVLSREMDIAIVASSDLSHYLPAEYAYTLDRLALEAIARVDAAGLLEIVRQQHISMCGVLPVAAMLTAGHHLGITAGKILHYHTSGDVIGDRREVVGYGTAALPLTLPRE